MGLVSDFKLWRKWDRARDAIEREGRMYDVRITLAKGFKALAISMLAVCASAAVAFLADPSGVTNALQGGGVSPTLVAVLVPLITALGHAAQNYLKNKD